MSAGWGKMPLATCVARATQSNAIKIAEFIKYFD